MTPYLIDTHVALWWADDSPRLAARHRAILENGSNEIVLSSVSVWEVAIKAAQGKLILPLEPLQFFQKLVERYHFTVLPIHLSHAAGVFSLPKVHADPFDRLLIAQCRSEGLPLVSEDSVFEKYDLPRLVGR
ncbi:type II toxin-antitoxin system VapC family toxin [bacterium]|nr:type II toxin-antitoxin system VapC family toxin [bacterium]